MYFVMKGKKLILGIALIVAIAIIFSVCITAFAAEGEKVELPVLMYHSIIDDSSRVGTYVISPEEFEKDLKYLKEQGYTAIGVSDLINYTENNGQLPDKPILLTFDDGYYNNYLYAYPLAQKYNSKIVISPIGYYTDEYSKEEKLSQYYSHITWDEIKEMSESGLVEFGNHTYNLHKSDGARLGTKKLAGESLEDYTNMLVKDVTEIQDKLTENTGLEPLCFAYPFGAVTKDTPAIINQLGFKCTLSCEEKMNLVTREPESLIYLGRYLRTQTRSAEDILKKG